MVKVELIEKDGYTRLEFTSNDFNKDMDLMDNIGSLILSSQVKRGGYSAKGVMSIDIKKEVDDGKKQ